MKTISNQINTESNNISDVEITMSNNKEGKDSSTTKISSEAAQNVENSWENVLLPYVNIAAIDNGLAFPFKHPDSWRTCKFILKFI